jgi:hypothetical protein
MFTEEEEPWQKGTRASAFSGMTGDQFPSSPAKLSYNKTYQDLGMGYFRVALLHLLLLTLPLLQLAGPLLQYFVLGPARCETFVSKPQGPLPRCY